MIAIGTSIGATPPSSVALGREAVPAAPPPTGVPAWVTSSVAVTPSDGSPLPRIAAGLLIGKAGTVVVRANGELTDRTFSVAAGAVLLVSARYVRATGTTASSILALYT